MKRCKGEKIFWLRTVLSISIDQAIFLMQVVEGSVSLHPADGIVDHLQ